MNLEGARLTLEMHVYFTNLLLFTISVPYFCRLWTKLTDAIYHKDMEAATDAKSEVENAQREAARKREESGSKHAPRFFEQNRNGQWVPKILYVDIPRSASTSGILV
jgi:hypothetical protein